MKAFTVAAAAAIAMTASMSAATDYPINEGDQEAIQAEYSSMMSTSKSTAGFQYEMGGWDITTQEFKIANTWGLLFDKYRHSGDTSKLNAILEGSKGAWQAVYDTCGIIIELEVDDVCIDAYGDGTGEADFTDYNVGPVSADVAAAHADGWTGKGFSITNGKGYSNYDGGSYFEIYKGVDIAPGAVFKDTDFGETSDQSIYLSNGITNKYMNFGYGGVDGTTPGTHKGAYEVFLTNEAAKTAVIWHKYYDRSAVWVNNLINDTADYVDSANWDVNGKVVGDDTELRIINVGNAMSALAPEEMG